MYVWVQPEMHTIASDHSETASISGCIVYVCVDKTGSPKMHTIAGGRTGFRVMVVVIIPKR
jgi:hypothetical protein